MNYLYHLLIPSDRNNYRAKLVHIDFLTFYLVIVLLFTAICQTNLVQTKVGDVLAVATDVTIDAIFQGTNQKRVENGLQTLSRNAMLDDAARRKAKYMFDNNLWAHYGRDGTTPWSFISATGYKYQYAGENLAQNFMFSSDVVNAWMASPSHRENILSNKYSEVGYAVVNGTLNGQETTLVVQMFGRPQTVNTATKTVSAKTNPSTSPKTIIKTQQKNTATIPTTVPQKNILPQKLATTTQISSIPFTSTFVIFTLLLVAFALDFYFAWKLKVVRISGKHMAHFIFIGSMLIGLVIISKGVIL